MIKLEADVSSGEAGVGITDPAEVDVGSGTGVGCTPCVLTSDGKTVLTISMRSSRVVHETSRRETVTAFQANPKPDNDSRNIVALMLFIGLQSGQLETRNSIAIGTVA